VDHLCRLIEQTLEQNKVLAQRLAAFEPSRIDTYTITTTLELTAATPAEARSTGNVNENASASFAQASGNSSILPIETPAWTREMRGFAFEELLMSSRAYRNAAHNNSDSFSVISSAGRTATWSMLSGLSLSEMSNIAILAIPIYASDINNKEAYTFDVPVTEDAVTVREMQTSLSPDSKDTSSSRKRWLKALVRGSPPTKRESQAQTQPSHHPVVFGAPLAQSLRFANVAITLTNEQDETFVYGYIPIVIAKIGVFLKEKGEFIIAR
jgi:hypothetical protein